MSKMIARLAELEAEVVESLGARTDRERDAIHRHTMLVAREGYMAGQMHGPDELGEESVRRGAALRFPLPPKKVLREEPDPDGCGWFYRWNPYNGGGMQSRKDGEDVWRYGIAYVPTPSRIALWVSLQAEPFKEVPDEG